MSKTNPNEYKKIIMTDDQMVDVVETAIEELLEKNTYDCHTDDLLTLYNDNVHFHWQAMMVIHVFFICIPLLVLLGYDWGAGKMSFFYILLSIIPFEGWFVYRIFLEFSKSKTIVQCLTIIKNEHPDLIKGIYFQRFANKNI